MSILVFDIETDSLTPSVIHCVGILDWETDTYSAFTGDDIAAALVRLSQADVLVGHWASEFDCPVIENLTDGLIRFDYSRLVDTVKLSRSHFPGLANHKLATWGELLGFPKLEHSDFETCSPTMLVYLERDVRLTAMLFDFLMSRVWSARSTVS